MQYFKDSYNRRLWHQSEDARELLDDQQLAIIAETLEHTEYELDFEERLRQIVFWSDYTIVNRLFYWITGLNPMRGYVNRCYSPILNALLESFITNKPICKQTQHQCDISLAVLGDFIKHDIPLADKDDAHILITVACIIASRPDLLKQSLHKIISSYHGDPFNNILLRDTDGLISYLFASKSVPTFLTPYVKYWSTKEYELMIALLDGHSLREATAPYICLSKKENAILHTIKLDLKNSTDFILERFVCAAKLLKMDTKETELVDYLLSHSKVFRDEFPTFKKDINFWFSVFRFLSRHQHHMNEYAMSHYIDYFESERYYRVMPLTYSLKGRTLASVNRAIDYWNNWYIYQPTYLKYTWDTLPIEKWMHSDNSTSYIIEEITDGKRLQQESKALKHCVYSYAVSCYNGNTHIFSLSKLNKEKKKPFVTIEVRKNQIVQMAGVCNSYPSTDIVAIVGKWAMENNIDIGHYF